MKRSVVVVTLLVMFLAAFLWTVDAWARAGGGGSSGSRGWMGGLMGGIGGFFLGGLLGSMLFGGMVGRRAGRTSSRFAFWPTCSTTRWTRPATR